MEFPILSSLIWTPILTGVLLLLIKQQKKVAYILAMLVAGLSLGVTTYLWFKFTPSLSVQLGLNAYQFVERVAWLPSLGIDYAVGIDGFALLLVMLTSLFLPIVLSLSYHSVHDRVINYWSCFLILQGLMHGVFMALDAVLFYLFWEAMLIPMFLIIGIWGGNNRIYATLKFFLYTFLGSVFLLVAIIYLHLQVENKQVGYYITSFYALKLSLAEQQWLFLAFMLAFAIKIPMWPVHTWLPDAHVESPTGGSVVLAAIMLKMGVYGIVRFAMPIVPEACFYYAGIVSVLSLIAIVYIGLAAIVQVDMKRLIAYSSVSHMGFVTLGLFAPLTMGKFAIDSLAMQGAIIQSISHGFISGALFICVGVLYDRMHTKEIEAYSGVAALMPKFAIFFVLFAMANAGLPGTSGFVGEFLVILGVFKYSFWYALAAGSTLLLAASYMLWLVKRVMFGMPKQEVAQLQDLTKTEFINLFILAGLVLVVGIRPYPLLEISQSSVVTLLGYLQG